MGLHHVELWIDDLELVRDEWAWLLGRVGLSRLSAWPGGETWGDGGAYLTLTRSPNLADGGHDRRRPGVNHLAFWAGGRGDVDAVMHDAPAHGWRPLYHERYPHAGGPDHYAGWLQNAAGFKVEVVAEPAAD